MLKVIKGNKNDLTFRNSVFKEKVLFWKLWSFLRKSYEQLAILKSFEIKKCFLRHEFVTKLVATEFKLGILSVTIEINTLWLITLITEGFLDWNHTGNQQNIFFAILNESKPRFVIPKSRLNSLNRPRRDAEQK